MESWAFFVFDTEKSLEGEDILDILNALPLLRKPRLNKRGLRRMILCTVHYVADTKKNFPWC